jgi:hypothetical protein
MNGVQSSVSGTGQLLAAAAGSKPLGEDLQPGQVYRAEVTAILDGKTEILLGNRYLLAASPFSFTPGDTLFLRLTALEPMLTFQLALPGADRAGDAEMEASMISVMRSARLTDNPANRAALGQVLAAGLPLTQQTFADVQALLASLPGAAVAAFMPLYRELLDRQIRPGGAVLRQLALLATQAPEVSALMLSLLPASTRPRRRAGSPALPEPALSSSAEVRIAKLAGSDAPPREEDLREMLQLLYGSAEEVLANTGSQAEFHDLSNVGLDADADDQDVTALLAAQRLLAALHPGSSRMLLPLSIDGMPVALELEHSRLEQEHYQQNHHLRMRLAPPLQGPVEVHFRTHGTSLSIQVLVQEEPTLMAYTAEMMELETTLRSEDTGYRLRELQLSAATLAPLGETAEGTEEIA